jgi:DNA-binding NarL/FixJ family response regulator
MEKIRVLVADRGEVFRVGLDCLLKNRKDIELVANCASGEQAIEKITELQPDVVLLDKYIEHYEFDEVIRHIRNMTDKPRIIVMLPYKDNECLTMLRPEATGYIDKDIPIQVLIGLFEDICKGEAFLSPGIAAKLLEQHTPKVPEVKEVKEEPHRETVEPLLTKRELDVLTLVSAKGFTNKEIASVLGISVGTVKTHLSNILGKMLVHNRHQAVTLAKEIGILHE